jgi:hypothetical protein
VRIELNRVAAIPASQTGKFRFIISNMPAQRSAPSMSALPQV